MLPATFTPKFLSQLELLRIQAQRSYLGLRQGGHLSLKRGHGIEFSDYRKYELGDNPRHIDWGVYARSERLYVKRFQEEQDLCVLIIIDTSASMITPDVDKKWERACEIALALSYIALMEQDSVIISALGSHISPTFYGAKAIHNINAALVGTKPGAQKDFVKEIQSTLARITFPGIAIFISDFLMPLEEIEPLFNLLRAKNLDITALQVLGAHDLKPLTENETARVTDSETGEEINLTFDSQTTKDYDALLEEHCNRLIRFFYESRISFSYSLTNEPLGDLIFSLLPQTGLVK